MSVCGFAVAQSQRCCDARHIRRGRCPHYALDRGTRATGAHMSVRSRGAPARQIDAGRSLFSCCGSDSNHTRERGGDRPCASALSDDSPEPVRLFGGFDRESRTLHGAAHHPLGGWGRVPPGAQGRFRPVSGPRPVAGGGRPWAAPVAGAPRVVPGRPRSGDGQANGRGLRRSAGCAPPWAAAAGRGSDAVVREGRGARQDRAPASRGRARGRAAAGAGPGARRARPASFRNYGARDAGGAARHAPEGNTGAIP